MTEVAVKKKKKSKPRRIPVSAPQFNAALNTKVDIRKKAALALFAASNKRSMSYYVQLFLDDLIKDNKLELPSLEAAIEILQRSDLQ